MSDASSFVFFHFPTDLSADTLITVESATRSDDDDYDIDFYTADPGLQENMDPGKPSPREQLEVSQTFTFS